MTTTPDPRFTAGQRVEFRNRTRSAEWEPGMFVRYDDPGFAVVTPTAGGVCRTEIDRIRPRDAGPGPGRPRVLELAAGPGDPAEHAALRTAVINAVAGIVTPIAVSGGTVAMITAAPEPPVPVPGEVTLLTFAVTVALPRDAALDRRDDITAHLAVLGIRLSMQQGTDTALADVGTPTIGDVLTGQADPDVIRGVERAAGEEWSR